MKFKMKIKKFEYAKKKPLVDSLNKPQLLGYAMQAHNMFTRLYFN